MGEQLRRLTAVWKSADDAYVVHIEIYIFYAVALYLVLLGSIIPVITLRNEPTSSCPGRSHLPSAKSGQLNFPRTKTDYGKSSFAVNGPVVWYSLPTELWSPDISLDVFKAKLETFLQLTYSAFGVFILILRSTNDLNNNNNNNNNIFGFALVYCTTS